MKISFACEYKSCSQAAGGLEILGEVRQSGALVAARPSRSAENSIGEK
jgi:hypothetical protein